MRSRRLKVFGSFVHPRYLTKAEKDRLQAYPVGKTYTAVDGWVRIRARKGVLVMQQTRKDPHRYVQLPPLQDLLVVDRSADASREGR